VAAVINIPSRLRAPHGPDLTGYTVLELLLVLAVVGMLAAVAWPSVMRMQADHDLSAAVEQVRQQLASARTRAVHSGTAYQFRFEPNGRKYCVVPFEAEPEPVNASSASSVPVGEEALQRAAGELSRRVSFRSPTPSPGGSTAAAKLPEGVFRGLPNAGALASVGWSAPLVFSPDGSAIDAVLTIADQRGYCVDVTVRGLTGGVTVGPMRQEALR
jgi:type II secretory pathway pseudopilin PulG